MSCLALPCLALFYFLLFYLVSCFFFFYFQLEDTQQKLQKQLLDQVQTTIGADAFAVASETSNFASGFFQNGMNLISQAFEDPKIKEKEKEKAIKDKSSVIKEGQKEENGDMKKIKFLAEAAAIEQNLSVEALSAQFVAMALQATGMYYHVLIISFSIFFCSCITSCCLLEYHLNSKSKFEDLFD